MQIAAGILLALILSSCPDDPASLFEQLTTSGIEIVDQQRCVLPPPLLMDDLDAAARMDVLNDLAGGRGWDKFSRRSFAAPVAIDVSYIKDQTDEQKRIGHLVRVAFIVHAPLARLKDEQLMEQLFGNLDESDDDARMERQDLAEGDLRAAGIDTIPDNESWGSIRMKVLRRVMLRGVARMQRTESDESLIVAWEIDPRFTGGNSERNTWSHIERMAAGETQEGEQHPYQGAGGYVHVSLLSELEEACLVEMHMVLHEPAEWFRGSHFLRSKIPVLMQENARRFRRRVMDP